MFLLVANGEFALCLLVVLCKGLELLNGRARRDGGGEFDVGFGVFVAGLWKSRKYLAFVGYG
jgi:hypothetical protein